MNAAGKTALLNTFTWALYGSFSRGFQFPDQLVNKRASLIDRPRKQGEVEQSLSHRVGRSSVLTYYLTRDGIEVDAIDLYGQGYDLIKQSPNDYEYTQIREVSHG